MAAKDPEEITWTIRFIIISISFFIFSWMIKLLNGSPANASLFVKIAFISIGLSFIFFINNRKVKPAIKKRKLSDAGQD